MTYKPVGFSDILTLARSSSGAFLTSAGTWLSVTAGKVRGGGVGDAMHHIWDGTTWEKAGLLLETEARTNLLLNSATLSTQSVTVTNVPHTLSFSGTGTVTLSGVSTAGPLVGTGTGEQNRVSLTFTPTAGTLTLTVSGTVTNAQLEAGQTPSSYITTTGSQVTRAAETLTIPAADMPYSSAAVCGCLWGTETYADEGVNSQELLLRWFQNNDNYIAIRLDTISANTGRLLLIVVNDGAAVSADPSPTQITPGTNRPFKVAWRVTPDQIAVSVNGSTAAVATGVGIPDLSGTDVLFQGNGTRSRLLLWKSDIGNAGIEEAST